MPYPIFPASPEMQKHIVQGAQYNQFDDMKYPFAHMNIGESISIPLAELNEKSVRVRMSTAKARYGVTLKMIKHRHLGVAEVGRIA